MRRLCSRSLNSRPKAFPVGAADTELRRRAPHIQRGTRAWLYPTLPVGEVVAMLTIENVVELPLDDLWGRYGRHAALSRTAFDAYFVGLSLGAALIIQDVQALKEPVSLQALRESGAFQPPQFYRVRQGGPGTRLWESELHPVVRLAIA